MKGKLIVLEGTDCSGKETQSNMLVDFLNNNGYNTIKFSFPNYDSPTGKIIAGAYLGKDGYMSPVFEEGASNVDPYCASLLFAMDRKYNIKTVKQFLLDGTNVVLDRYIDSNMAHQGAKLDSQEQEKMFTFLETLEYGLLELPKPDYEILLYMPLWASRQLKQNRKESADQHEQDEKYLEKAESLYLKIANHRNMPILDCTTRNSIKSKVEISTELCKRVLEFLKQNKL